MHPLVVFADSGGQYQSASFLVCLEMSVGESRNDDGYGHVAVHEIAQESRSKTWVHLIAARGQDDMHAETR